MATGGGGGGGSKAIEAGAAFVRLFTNDSELQKGLKNAQHRVAAFGAAMQKVGAVALGAGAAALGLAGAAVGSFLDRAKEVQFLATKLGVPVERLSAFAYAAEATGVSLEDLAGHFENLAERVHQFATDGSGEAKDTFRQLGIDADRLRKLAPDEQLIALSEAMQGVTNETQRLGMLSSMGGDQFQKLNDLFKRGPDAIRAYMAEAKELGVVLSPEQSEKAAAATTELSRGWAAARGVVASFAMALLPSAGAIREFGRQAVAGVVAVRQFVEANRPLVVGAGLVAAGAAFIGVGTGLSLAATALGGFATAVGAVATAVGALVSPVGLAAAAVAGLGYLFVTQTEAGKRFGAEVGATFTALKDTAVETWGGISAALSKGDLALAGRVAFAGLEVAFLTGQLKLTEAWVQFNTTFLDAFRDAAGSVAKVFATLTDDIGAKLDGMESRFSRLDSASSGVATGMLSGAAGLVGGITRDQKDGFLAGLSNGMLGGSAGLGQAAQEIGRDPAVQAERDRARSAQLEAIAAALAAAKAAMAALVEEAKKAAPAAAVPPKKPDLATLVTASGKATGAFLGGADEQQVFGQGLGVQNQQLAVQRKMLEQEVASNEKLDKLNDALRQARPLVFS